LPVGGIREKILAAKRANIKELILCHENKSDIDEIKPEYIKV
jgi:ATP-dependent Lon protease